MALYDQLVEALPELEITPENDLFGMRGCIELQDDSDGKGAYIKKWEYSKPIPKGFILGKV